MAALGILCVLIICLTGMSTARSTWEGSNEDNPGDNPLCWDPDVDQGGMRCATPGSFLNSSARTCPCNDSCDESCEDLEDSVAEKCNFQRSCDPRDEVTGDGDGCFQRAVEYTCKVQYGVAMNSTHTSGQYGDVACPPGSVIEVLDAWAADTGGRITCTLPLSQVDAPHLSEIQGCSGTSSCSHVGVVTGKYTSCPGSVFGDIIDTIIVEFQCVPDDVTTTGTSTEMTSSLMMTSPLTMTSPHNTRQGSAQTGSPGTTSEGATHYTAAPDSQTPGLGLYIGVAVGAVAILLLIVIIALVCIRKRKRATEKSTELASFTRPGAPAKPRNRFSDYENHDHVFESADAEYSDVGPPSGQAAPVAMATTNPSDVYAEVQRDPEGRKPPNGGLYSLEKEVPDSKEKSVVQPEAETGTESRGRMFSRGDSAAEGYMDMDVAGDELSMTENTIYGAS